MTALLLFGILTVLIIASVPIGVSLGLAVLIVMATTTNTPVILIAQNAFAGLDSFPLLAIPFFILAGNLMTNGGIAKRLIDLANSVIGAVRGGLGIVTVLACLFFAAISGSAPATVSAIGTPMIPALTKAGYPKGFSCSLTASAGTVGVILPPSIPFVVYGVVSGVSIGEIFLAGIVPGVLVGIVIAVLVYIIARVKGYAVGEASPEKGMARVKKVLKQAFDSFWAILTPLIILGGIYAGIFTPTESAVVAIVYAMIVGKFIYKEVTMKVLVDSARDTGLMTGITIFCIGLSMSFSNFLTMQQIPAQLGNFLTSVTDSKIVILLLVNLLLLVVGLCIDNISSMIILTPVFLPILMQFGVDPVHFGVFMTIALSIGFVTPPYGVNMFVAATIAKIGIEKTIVPSMPFILALISCLMLVTYIPDIAMLLPNLVYGR